MVDNIERIDLSQEIALVQKRVPQEGSIPSPRSSALAVLLTSGKIWMLGGNSNENEFSDLYELDLQTLKWKKLYGDWKTKWTGSAGIVMKTGLSEKDIIIQYGGFCGDSYSDSLYLLECNSLTIKEAKRDEQHGKLKTMDMKKRIENDKLQPNSRRDHTMTYIQEPSCIIMIGGWNSIEWSPDDIRLDFWVLDSRWKWLKINLTGHLALNRRGHTTTYIADKNLLIVYGGVFGYSKLLSDCFSISQDSLAHDSTLKVNDQTLYPQESEVYYPEGRAWHSSHQIGSFVYFFGGCRADTMECTSEIVRYDYEHNTWSHLEILDQNFERMSHVGLTFGECIQILGGYNESSTYCSGLEDFDMFSDRNSVNSSSKVNIGVKKSYYFKLNELLVFQQNGANFENKINKFHTTSQNFHDKEYKEKTFFDFNVSSFPYQQMIEELDEVRKKVSEYDIDSLGHYAGNKNKSAEKVDPDPFAFLPEHE